MQKDFQAWHKAKQSIHDRGARLFYHEREVWWCFVGLNVGFEMDGKGKKYTRPVLVLKGFSREVCIVVPLTTKLKTGKFYADIYLPDGIRRQVMLSQVRLIDTKRLRDKIYTLPEEEFTRIKQAAIQLLE